jgi:tetratricopeptide (TPR) repeat protein
MSTRQLLLISSCLLIGAAVFLLPRTADVQDEPHTDVVSEDFSKQLEEVKKQTPAEQLGQIEFFENKLKGANGSEKIQWLDSLRKQWDKQMRPGIAAEYVLQKAELANDALSWKDAGMRFLGLASFFADADKNALLQRAIACLEKANELKANDPEIKTQLGIAYVEGSQEPMKGIALLREAVAEDSTNVDAQLSLGFFSMKSGQYDKAVKRFTTVSKLRPDLPEVNLYLADALSMNGDKKGALSVIDKLLSTTTDSLIQASANQRKKDIQQN